MASFKLLFLTAGALMAMNGVVFATPISTLFSTGVDAKGNILADGSPDPHYQLTSVPDGASSKITTDTVSANWGWPKAASNSAFISPVGGPAFAPNGWYIYTTTFSLTGFDASTAKISGQVSGDDAVSISLNGGDYFATGATWSTTVAFALTSGFVSGLNTLNFAVYNSGGATGLDVSQSGAATATVVPEPTTLSILGTACIALGLVGWRRRSKPATA